MLCEGIGIRAIERLTGLNRRTVLNILQVAGEKATRLLDSKIRDLESAEIQADELFCFVYTKPQNTPKEETERGEFFTYLAVARESKLIVTWRTGKRTAENTDAFLADLRGRLRGEPQLTTDGMGQYAGVDGGVQRVFGSNVHYATEIKRFAKPSLYEPRKVIGISRRRKIGNPDMSRATICHTERTNLSVRLFTRRFTRCTLGYSKKLQNLRYAVALFIAHFNFCRTHSSLRIEATDTQPAQDRTPAMAEGITERVWTVAELFSPTLASWTGAGWIGKDLQP